MTTPTDIHFDLIAVQRINGAFLGTLASDVPADKALDALALSANEDWGYGTVTMLVASRDPLHQVRAELERARGKHAALNSAHEAYAVILEELDEFKAEVWKKRSERDPAKMREELIQIAAMALRTIEDLEL